MAERYCWCGTRIARDNHGSECSLCARLRRVARSGEHGPLAVRLGRRLAEIYAAYGESDSRERYLAELTPLLDGLCELFGFRVPQFEGVAKPLRISSALEGSSPRLGCLLGRQEHEVPSSASTGSPFPTRSQSPKGNRPQSDPKEVA